jgi:adenylate cyclase
MHGTQLASGIGTVLIILVLGPLGALEPLETWWFDRLFELRGSRAPTTPIVIVTIDESSITEINLQWPFPRARHADLIDLISAAHPLAIGVDLLFDGPSAWGARDDEAFGAAIMRAGNVGLAHVWGNRQLRHARPLDPLDGRHARAGAGFDLGWHSVLRRADEVIE